MRSLRRMFVVGAAGDVAWTVAGARDVSAGRSRGRGRLLQEARALEGDVAKAGGAKIRRRHPPERLACRPLDHQAEDLIAHVPVRPARPRRPAPTAIAVCAPVDVTDEGRAARASSEVVVEPARVVVRCHRDPAGLWKKAGQAALDGVVETEASLADEQVRSRRTWSRSRRGSAPWTDLPPRLRNRHADRAPPGT